VASRRYGVSRGIPARRRLAAAGAALAVWLGATSAPAAHAALERLVKFDDPGVQGGTLSYSGGLGSPLIGSGIPFDLVTQVELDTGSGLQTPIGPSLACDACVLWFETGGSTAAGPDTWVFGSGGSFSLTGTVLDGPTQIATGTLLSGGFDADAQAFSPAASPFGYFGGNASATLDASLASHFGLPEAGEAVLTQIYFETSVNPTSVAFNAFVTDADINFRPDSVGVPPAAVVPLPLGGWLLGAGLLGYLAYGSRRRRGHRDRLD
jgi:hypothetical protein